MAAAKVCSLMMTDGGDGGLGGRMMQTRRGV